MQLLRALYIDRTVLKSSSLTAMTTKVPGEYYGLGTFILPSSASGGSGTAYGNVGAIASLVAQAFAFPATSHL